MSHIIFCVVYIQHFVYLLYSSGDDDTLVNEIHDSDNSSVNTVLDNSHAPPTGKNGRRPIDLTPPDVLLQRSEKRVTRFIRNKDVS